MHADCEKIVQYLVQASSTEMTTDGNFTCMYGDLENWSFTVTMHFAQVTIRTDDISGTKELTNSYVSPLVA